MRPLAQVPATSGGAPLHRSPWLRASAGFVAALLALGAGAHTRGAEAPPAVDDFAVLADAIVLEGSGKAQEAVSKIAQHTFGAANEATAAALRGRILEDAGQLGPAWDVYEEARKRHPEDAALNLRAGVMSFARGDLGLAEERLRRSWAGARTAEAAYYLGVLCVSSGRTREARVFFVQAVVLDGPGIWREEEQGSWRSMATKDLTSRGRPAIMHLPTPR
jgi:tetratricopeptide (TPR) repeat protein